MDLTEEFTSCCGRTQEEPGLMLADPNPKRILRVQPRPDDGYLSRARGVSRHVEQLREFLLIDPDGAVDREGID